MTRIATLAELKPGVQMGYPKDATVIAVQPYRSRAYLLLEYEVEDEDDIVPRLFQFVDPTHRITLPEGSAYVGYINATVDSIGKKKGLTPVSVYEYPVTYTDEDTDEDEAPRKPGIHLV